MHSLTIAIVEDDEITLDMITVALEDRLDATVYSFSRSRQAAEFLVKQNKDSLNLIITDKNMPDIDGFQLLSVCQRAGLKVPALMITADADLVTVLTARKAGVVGFLAKPVVIDHLLEKVQEIIT